MGRRHVVAVLVVFGVRDDIEASTEHLNVAAEQANGDSELLRQVNRRGAVDFRPEAGGGARLVRGQGAVGGVVYAFLMVGRFHDDGDKDQDGEELHEEEKRTFS